jgi:hypothetical protein
MTAEDIIDFEGEDHKSAATQIGRLFRLSEEEVLLVQEALGAAAWHTDSEQKALVIEDLIKKFD